MAEASSAFTEDHWLASAADQEAMAEAGEDMFSRNRNVFTAVKPQSQPGLLRVISDRRPGRPPHPLSGARRPYRDHHLYG
jgi:hypothetical protein